MKSPKIPLTVHTVTRLADLHTPVGLYLKLRDRFSQSLLLESADYHGKENALSFLCLDPWAEIKLDRSSLKLSIGAETETLSEVPSMSLPELVQEFLARFQWPENQPVTRSNYAGGAFGYMSYDAIPFFENIHFREKQDQNQIPTLWYRVFRFVCIFDHFNNTLTIMEQFPSAWAQDSRIPELESLMMNKNLNEFPFRKVGEEKPKQSDAQFLEGVKKGIAHCLRGDVFQIVLSRRFSQAYQGDDFNVYRQLRSINPSPYLFYFDFGSFRLFGSSPEAQIVIKGKKASIFPIAGTFRRSGDEATDAAMSEKLLKDEKENAEHIMLVDLARNDLSRSCVEVWVEKLREVQYYSHVIHLVSKVSGILENERQKLALVAQTFPAGTLSGAPKYRAMQLIDEIEPTSRGFYAGALGFIGFNGDYNHAILIRSFLAKDHVLYFQAGAGVVAASQPESELAEVTNKLSALRLAMEKASEISHF